MVYTAVFALAAPSPNAQHNSGKPPVPPSATVKTPQQQPSNVAGTDADEQGIKRINIGRQYQPQTAGIVCGAECCQGNAGTALPVIYYRNCHHYPQHQ